MKKFIWSSFELLEIFIIVFIVVFVIRYFFAQPFVVSGCSMEPNFHGGDYLIVDEVTYRLRPPQRGEVIVFEPPFGNQYFIKRVIGLPNEIVTIKQGKIIISNSNGHQWTLEEDYLPENVFTSSELKVRLGKDEYFVLGDNRSKSCDSRNWGPLKRDKIIGRVRLRLWPPFRIDSFE